MRGRLVLTLSAAAVAGEFLTGRKRRWQGAVALAGVAEVAAAVSALAEQSGIRPGSPLDVLVEQPLVQQRTLPGLPALSRRDLRAAVALQAGRFFRRNGQPLVTDARWTRTKPPVAHAAALEEPWAEALAAGAAKAGLFLRSVRPAGSTDSGLQLLPASLSADRRRAARRLVARLTQVGAMLWLLAGAIYVGRLEWQRAAVHRELAAIAGPMQALAGARAAFVEAEGMVAAMEQLRARRGQVHLVLASVATALPDSAYLTTFTLRPAGPGLLTGVAPSALAVLAALDQSGTLPGARLEGSPVRESIGAREMERFTIAFGRPTGTGEAAP